MYVKINKPTEHNHNKGTCKNLIEYLEKEDIKELGQSKCFFSLNRDHISGLEAQTIIDGNTAKLGKKDSKFFHISINPSQKELEHIAMQVTGKRVRDYGQMTENEMAKFDLALKDYTHNVMDGYARNFNRGLEGKDLVYVAKVESERTYDRFSKEVKHNREVKKMGEGAYICNSKGEVIKENMPKEGMQHHVHVVVSRKDVTNKIKLSPFANARNAKNKLDGKEVQIGFDRKAFVSDTEKRFDVQFNYNRSFKHSFEYKHAMSYPYKGMIKQIAKQQITNAIGNPKQDLMRELGIDNIEGFTAQTQQLFNIISKGIAPQKIVLDIAKKAIQKTLFS